MSTEGSIDGLTPTETDRTVWSPNIFLKFTNNCSRQYALLILNQPIDMYAPDLFREFWYNAKLRVCADGGANRLYDQFDENQRLEFLPNSICGDMDSIRPEVKDYYSSKGVAVYKDVDQYSTDFSKSLVWISQNQTPQMMEAGGVGGGSEKQEHLDILATGGSGGRVDQYFHSIHQLFVANLDKDLKRRVFLISDESLTFLLRQGRNIIDTPMTLFGPTCGIIPVGMPSIISTAGLEWNLRNTETVFGGMVSTSNHIVRNVVEIETSNPIVFTAELRKQIIEGGKGVAIDLMPTN